jgi:hypothetical protein
VPVLVVHDCMHAGGQRPVKLVNRHAAARVTPNSILLHLDPALLHVRNARLTCTVHSTLLERFTDALICHIGVTCNTLTTCVYVDESRMHMVV